jgi:hypothetical protein
LNCGETIAQDAEYEVKDTEIVHKHSIRKANFLKGRYG